MKEISFEDKSDEVEKDLAILLGSVSHHIHHEIIWLKPILPTDWKDRIDSLLNYRIKHLRNKYSKI